MERDRETTERVAAIQAERKVLRSALTQGAAAKEQHEAGAVCAECERWKALLRDLMAVEAVN